MSFALMDLATAVVIVSAALTQTGNMAGPMLVDEVHARSGLRWETAADWPASSRPVVWVGTERELSGLPEKLRARTADLPVSGRPEGYRVTVVRGAAAPSVLVIGHDARGALYGVGRLLRSLRVSPGKVWIADKVDVTSSPRLLLRGHQLGYRNTPNSYDAWDFDRWEQYYRDLIVFGANAVELIPPGSDGKPGAIQSAEVHPLFPRPEMDMMIGMSALADKYDLDVWIWYPAILGDYADPAVRENHLEKAEDIFRKLKRIDDVFVPGGDPGDTDPAILMPLLDRKAALLRKYHPRARMWVSPQGFGRQWLDAFIATLRERPPEWLAGVVYGPGVRMPLKEFRRQIPARYPIRSYPDICHNFQCQYPVPAWDRAYAVTEGREPINPRPLDQAAIFQFELPDIQGVLTYSEGCTDDVNKAIWSGLAWNPDTPVIDILRDYGRYFIADDLADDFAQGILALERNWRGPLSSNRGVETTLAQFQAMEQRASPALLRNWRFEQALYRAYYDAFVQRRLQYETELEARAVGRLREDSAKGVAGAIREATAILGRAETEPVAAAWRKRIFELADNLFHDIGLQLSVAKYHAKAVNRGANLDMIDFPLNNRRWLLSRFDEILRLPDEKARLRAVDRIVGWTDPGPGGFYDDLGDVANEPHLVRGPGFAFDPGVLRSPADDFELIKDLPFYREHPYRTGWLSRASTLHGTPLRLRYTDLSPFARYRVRVVYAADRDDFVPKIRLTTDDGFEIHPFLSRPIPAAPLEFPVPPAATADGELGLELNREITAQGNGRGAQIAEIWLLKEHE